VAIPLHFGPARVPSRASPEEAIALLQERGYTACEIDFEGKFWMDYAWAETFGQLAREAGIVLSVHAPIAGFMGHAERGKKLNMAVGMLDHSAGIAKTAGAELVGARESSLSADEVDSLLREGRLGPCRHRIREPPLAPQNARPIDRDLSRLDAVLARAPDLVQHFGGANEHLLRIAPCE